MSRSQALYITESGTTLTIAGQDSTTGSLVKCVAASGYTIVSQSDVPDQLPAKAIVVGKRSDGKPGIWVVGYHNKIRLPANEEGDEGTLSPHHGEGPYGLHSGLGWTYKVTAVTGNFVLGYAINEKGFEKGPISIPAGTQVAVYWKMFTRKDNDHIFITPPMVIGTYQATYKHNSDAHRGHRHHYQFLGALRLFFLNKLDNYLVSASGVTYDTSSDSYIVTGVDQDGNDAQATIASNGSITIVETTPPPATTYSNLIIETFNPNGNGFNPNFDILTLYSESGAASAAAPYTTDPNALASGENNNPNGNQTGYAYIDYQPSTPLTSGTVLYVRVTGGSSSITGPYGIRVITTASSTYPVLGVSATTANEPNNTPTSTGVATLQPGDSLSSYLDPAGDVDWYKITLP